MLWASQDTMLVRRVCLRASVRRWRGQIGSWGLNCRLLERDVCVPYEVPHVAYLTRSDGASGGAKNL